MKRIAVAFFKTAAGGEPVRTWLKGLDVQDRYTVGHDIALVEFGWPVGMPTCRSLGEGLYEVRSSLRDGKIVRVLFYIDVLGRMILLHGFIKKTQKTPTADLELARNNRKLHSAALRGSV